MYRTYISSSRCFCLTESAWNAEVNDAESILTSYTHSLAFAVGDNVGNDGSNMEERWNILLGDNSNGWFDLNDTVTNNEAGRRIVIGNHDTQFDRYREQRRQLPS